MPSWARPCRALATRGWRSTPKAAWTCGDSRPGSCGPNATASGACSTKAPCDRARELERASARRAEADQALEQLTATNGQEPPVRGMLRLPWRAEPAATYRAAALLARQQADRAADVELGLRQHQQRRAGWLEANAHPGLAYRQVIRELAWQRRATVVAAGHEQPGYLRGELGPVPDSTRGRRAWRQAAAAIEDYRRTYQITDPEQALGRMPHQPAQRAAWQHARQAITPDPGPPPQHRPRPPTAAGRDIAPVPHRSPPAGPGTNPHRTGRAPRPAGPRAGRRLAPQGPGALLSSDECRVERRAGGCASSVMASAAAGGAVAG